LLIPVVVVEESVRHFEDSYADHFNRLPALQSLLEIVNESPELLPEPAEVAKMYRQRLISRLEELGAQIRDLPDIKVGDLFQRDIEARRPFDRIGRGMRDARIWEVILVECSAHEMDIIIISADGDFELDPSNRQKAPILHPDLQDDLDLLGLPSERVRIVRHLHQFNEEFALPLVDRVYRKGEDPAGTFVEGVNPVDLLTRYGEVAARELHQDLPFILPIGRGFADRVSFLQWPIDPELLEALDLGGGKIQLIIRARVVFDTEVYGAEETTARLFEFARGKPKIVSGPVFNQTSNDFSATIRVSLFIDFVLHWLPANDQIAAFDLLRYGYDETQIEEGHNYLY
jgi:hypothetical protein